MIGDVASDEPQLVSLRRAAVRLGLNPKTVRAHLPLVRVGRKMMVRVADIQTVVSGGQVDAA